MRAISESGGTAAYHDSIQPQQQQGALPHPFPPGTQEAIAGKIVLAQQVIGQLQKAQAAGLNVATLLVRANQAHDTLHRIHAAYYGPSLPQSQG